ncbi:MAG TPA: DUF4157 domain-containing protein [Permianibacter sp.]|nr:DUF4157 domain-containing protein [Permianibacter sp.]
MQAGKQKTSQASRAPTSSRSPVARMVAVSAPVSVQASALKVSSPQDAAEKEADSTARKVMRMPAPQVQSGGSEVDKEKNAAGKHSGVLQRAKANGDDDKGKDTLSATGPRVQRKSGAANEKELQRQAALPEKDRESVKKVTAGAPAMTPTTVARSVAIVMPKAEGQPNVASNVAAEIQNSMTAGAELPLSVRRFMEPRFRADFSAVKVHTGDKAAKLNRQLSAQAFTIGNHIFFGRNKFQPDSGEGQELLAHELTHTIQQGAVAQQSASSSNTGSPATTARPARTPAKAPVPARTVGAIQRREVALQRSEDATVSQRAPTLAQRLGISDALDYFADKAHNIPGYRMFTIVLGVNPINMSRVDRSAANILRAIVEFIPGGNLVTQALDNHGVFDKVGNWVEQQIRSLGMTGAAIKQAVSDFLDSLSWRDIFDLGGVWQRAKRIFTEPIDQIISFAKGLITGIIQFIKDAILRPLARLAEGTQGYDLLKAVLGQDPITGDPVPRTADTLIGGFMKLIGQEEVWNNIKKGNAVARAWAWFQGALGELMGFVREIPSLFVQAFTSLELADIVLLPNAFAKVGKVFGGFIGRFTSWAFSKVVSLLEILFSVVAPGAMPYIKKAAGAFQSILRNPIGFVGNLVRAGKLGFQQFARNIGQHLRTSLIQWLTGTMAGAGVYVPQSFDLREIIKFVLSVLGLTWQNIRQKLVRVVGEGPVRAMETGFDLVVTLVTQGPAAAWNQIREGISNLREMVVEQVMSFVVTRIVQSVITKLVTSLNPAGAVIQAIIAIYNTIMFFIERIRQIAAVAASFINSISAIASGAIGAAANRVEQTMAGLLTLVISFLARIGGLGRVSDAVMNIVRRIRAPIDRALDRVVNWIVTMARRLGRFVAQAGVPQDPATRVRLASQAAVAAARRLTGTVTEGLLNPIFVGIRTRYGLQSINAFQRGGSWWVRVVVNPTGEEDLGLPTGAPGSTAGTVNIPPIIAKLDQATAMFQIFQSRGSSRVATQMLAELASAKTEAQGIDQAQRQRLPAARLDLLKQALSRRLQAIQNLDPGYTLFSIGALSVTITQAQRQLPTVTPTPWDVADPALRPEYTRQLQDQENGINAMTAEQWFQNRDRFVTHGRSSTERNMRATFRRRTGQISGTAAPHNADQVAGGFEDPTGVPANARVNSHIGSQWPARVGVIQTAVNALSAVARLVTQMSVRLRPR